MSKGVKLLTYGYFYTKIIHTLESTNLVNDKTRSLTFTLQNEFKLIQKLPGTGHADDIEKVKKQTKIIKIFLDKLVEEVEKQI
jgi:hypothetical protein